MWSAWQIAVRGSTSAEIVVFAVAVWGVGIMMAPILGPTVGGWIADNWSWRWIFYINLPIGVLGFFMASALLFDKASGRRLDVRIAA